MADDKVNYPQVPSTVWWGVRGILQNKPSATIDAKLLSINLGVQEAAASAYVKQLQNLKVLDGDGKATATALKWRLDSDYAEAASALLEMNYPDTLRDTLPPAPENREKIVQWFMYDGLGRGAAGNKASTYLLIGSPTPNGADVGVKAKPAKSKSTDVSKKEAAPNKPKPGSNSAPQAQQKVDPVGNGIPLNLNMQIHISADASNEQIEQVF
jgi:hypothetical protein